MFRLRFFAAFSAFFSASIFTLSVFASSTPGGLTLDDLYGSGAERNESIQQAKERFEQSGESVSQARGGFFPQLSLIGTYARTDTGNSLLATSPWTSQTNARINGKQYLFQGGVEYATYGRLSRLESAAEQDYIFARQNYYLSLAQTYFDALKAESQLRYAENETKLYADQVGELKKRVSIGRSRPSELLASQSALAQSEARRLSLESELAASKTNLRTLAKTEGPLNLKEALPFSPSLSNLDEYLKDAENRPDLKSAIYQREAASKNVWAYRFGHLPTLDLSGNYWLRHPSSSVNSKWDATLTLTIPIFSGGITQSRVREAASQYKAAEVAATRIQNELRDEIQNLYTTLKSSIEEVKSLETAVDLAQKSYNQVSRDYRLGLTTHLEVLQSLKNLQDSHRQLDDARYRHYSERVRLEVRCGRLPKT